MTRFVALLLLAALALCTAATAEGPPGAVFDRSAEFPNFFLPARYRNTAPEDIPPEVLRTARTQVERALHSVFERLTVPIIQPGTSEVRQVRYFEHLRRNVDSRVNIMPSGGVVRSAISYLYAEIYAASRAVPSRTPEQVLASLIAGRADIPAFLIRGIGSDFDVLVDGPRELLGAAQETIRTITNSAINRYGGSELRGNVVRSLFTLGDVKIYDEQIALSTRQGGATIDFLAFDLRGEGAFREPPNHGFVVDDLLLGRYRYIAPNGENARDPDKQTIRGIRALLELPFLTIHGDERLRGELDALIAKLDRGEAISPKAAEQINRAIRNARFSGGNNRLYRAGEDSLERRILRLLDRARAAGVHIGFPEFVDHHPIDARNPQTRGELHGLARELLTPMGDFIRNHTHRGTLFHGTPNIDDGFAILRGGLFVSGGRNRQGAYVMGSGGYSSPQRGVAEGYAGSNGMVLELTVNQSERLNILNLDLHGNDSRILAIRRRAEAEGKDFHQVLAREHGIDIIIHGHVLIQNMAALRTENNPAIILRGLHSVLQNSAADTTTRWNAYQQYIRLHPYALSLGAGNIPTPPTGTEMIRAIEPQLLRDIETEPVATEQFLRDIYQELTPRLQREVARRLIQLGHFELVQQFRPTSPTVLRALLAAADNPAHAGRVARVLVAYAPDRFPHSVHGEILQTIRRLLLDSTLARVVDKTLLYASHGDTPLATRLVELAVQLRPGTPATLQLLLDVFERGSAHRSVRMAALEKIVDGYPNLSVGNLDRITRNLAEDPHLGLINRRLGFNEAGPPTPTSSEIARIVRGQFLERIRELSLRMHLPVPSDLATLNEHQLMRRFGELVRAAAQSINGHESQRRRYAPNRALDDLVEFLYRQNAQFGSWNDGISSNEFPMSLGFAQRLAEEDPLRVIESHIFVEPRLEAQLSAVRRRAFEVLRDRLLVEVAHASPEVRDAANQTFRRISKEYPWDVHDVRDRRLFLAFENDQNEISFSAFRWNIDDPVERAAIFRWARENAGRLASHLQGQPDVVAEWRESPHFEALKRILRASLRNTQWGRVRLDSNLWDFPRDLLAIRAALEHFGHELVEGSPFVQRLAYDPTLRELRDAVIRHQTRYVRLSEYFPPPFPVGLDSVADLRYWKAAATEHLDGLFTYLRAPGNLTRLRQGARYGSFLQELRRLWAARQGNGSHTGMHEDIVAIPWNWSNEAERETLGRMVEAEPLLGLRFLGSAEARGRLARARQLDWFRERLETGLRLPTSLAAIEAIHYSNDTGLERLPFRRGNASDGALLRAIFLHAPQQFFHILSVNGGARDLVRADGAFRSEIETWLATEENARTAARAANVWGDRDSYPWRAQEPFDRSFAEALARHGELSTVALGEMYRGLRGSDTAAAERLRSSERSRMVSGLASGWMPHNMSQIPSYPWDEHDASDRQFATRLASRLWYRGGAAPAEGVLADRWFLLLKALAEEVPGPAQRALLDAMAADRDFGIRVADHLVQEHYANATLKDAVVVPFLDRLLRSANVEEARQAVTFLSNGRIHPAALRPALEALLARPELAEEAGGVLARFPPSDVSTQWLADRIRAGGPFEPTRWLLQSHPAGLTLPLLRALREALTPENAWGMYEMFSREELPFPEMQRYDSADDRRRKMKDAVEAYLDRRIVAARADTEAPVRALRSNTWANLIALLESSDPELLRVGLQRLGEKQSERWPAQHRERILLALIGHFRSSDSNIAWESSRLASQGMVRGSGYVRAPAVWRALENVLLHGTLEARAHVVRVLDGVRRAYPNLNLHFETPLWVLLRPLLDSDYRNHIRNLLYMFQEGMSRGPSEHYQEMERLTEGPSSGWNDARLREIFAAVLDRSGRPAEYAAEDTARREAIARFLQTTGAGAAGAVAYRALIADPHSALARLRAATALEPLHLVLLEHLLNRPEMQFRTEAQRILAGWLEAPPTRDAVFHLLQQRGVPRPQSHDAETIGRALGSYVDGSLGCGEALDLLANFAQPPLR